jgi:isopentenyl diphosphate isomerase/L-lactate dehydrogenase-like FMN-dependent dehydrogenase
MSEVQASRNEADSSSRASASRLTTVEAYRLRAREVLPRPQWDTLFGDYGAPGWESNTNSFNAYRNLKLRPRVLTDARDRDMTTTVLGTEVSMPVMVASTGAHQRYHAEGEMASARSAGRAGVMMLNSTTASFTIEEVAEAATGPLWFQLYFMNDWRVTELLVRRAEDTGHLAVVVTVDNPGVPLRERHTESRWSGLTTYDLGAEHTGAPPYEQRRELINFKNLNLDGWVAPDKSRWHRYYEPGLSWDHVRRLRALTTLPIVIKGIQTAEDSRLCVENGVDGIIVSSHGGFAGRDAKATIEQLPEVVGEAGSLEVFVDGGITRGGDVMKALALGARAVCVGRAQCWGLAVGGEDGSAEVLEILRNELDDSMRHCGVSNITAVDRSLVEQPPRPGGGSLAVELDRLVGLHQNGHLSDEEFATAKRRCLG